MALEDPRAVLARLMLRHPEWSDERLLEAFNKELERSPRMLAIVFAEAIQMMRLEIEHGPTAENCIH